MGIFKTRHEFDQEDNKKYFEKQQYIRNRQRARFETEGFKCKVQGCGASFKDFGESQVHHQQHLDDMHKAMICNQPNCAQKFNNRRAYNEHIRSHKEEAKRKTLNSIRAVLLYNQLGLVLDDFEREYKVTTGKPVPFKLLGFSSILELLHNSPDVVKVLQLDNGPTIVLPVVDEKTLHVAKLVGNQEFSTKGFNWRTGDVMSRLDERTVNKISQEVGFRDKEVSALVKSQLRELLEMDANLNGILLSQLPSEYYKMFSYHIDYEEYGFKNLEDFCLNGLSSDVDVDLDCGNFKIVEKGLIGMTKSISVPKDIPDQVKNNLKSLMRNPVMEIEDLRRKYFDNVEPLKLLEFGVHSFDELCLFLPDCLLVKGGEVRLPVTEEKEVRGDLSKVAVNVAELLQGRKECLDLRDFIRGYEGFYGDINKAVKDAGAKGVIQLLSMLEDVCYLETSASGQTVVGSTQASLSGKVQLNNITLGQGWG